MPPELELMLDALAEQHKLHTPSDIFPFSWLKGQQYFDDHNASTKYGIDPPCGCIPLILELSKRGIIKARVMTIEQYGIVPESFEPGNSEWNEYVFPIGGKYLICDVCMNNKDVQKAKYNLGEHHQATLMFADNKDDDNSMPYVRIKGDKDYAFRRLRTDGYPYKVFDYAVKQKRNNRNEPIYIEELIAQKKMRADHDYVSNLFKDQPIITEALAPFVELTTKSIYIKSFSAVITDAQKELIQKHAR